MTGHVRLRRGPDSIDAPFFQTAILTNLHYRGGTNGRRERSVIVPNFRITVVNQHFRSSNDVDLPTIESARAEAIKGALQIASDEVSLDRPFFGAEVSIESEDQGLDRYVVSVGVSPIG